MDKITNNLLFWSMIDFFGFVDVPSFALDAILGNVFCPTIVLAFSGATLFFWSLDLSILKELLFSRSAFWYVPEFF